MSHEPIPGSGQDGEEPPPVSGGGFGADGAGADGFDLDAAMDRLAAGIDAGQVQIPPETECAQGLSFIAAGPQDLAALGVNDLAGLGVAGFAQGGAADVMPPGMVLLGLAGAACEPGTLRGLGDGQVLGVAGAGRRLAALAAWVQMTAVAEFAARRPAG
ncbi:MAG: hypothetical protein JO242_04665, partial [Streptosporangiaceae bacterium]|nr:hypothetical protein [Streptosporangiaceae bacterium]